MPAESPPTFDLQSHSVHSDGALTAAEVVRAAAAAGVRLLALTDHDTAEGVREAAATAAAIGIGLVPGIEVTAMFDDHPDLHILGYRIDSGDETLAQALRRSRGNRTERAGRMTELLRDLGFAVDDELLAARSTAGQSVGRPHLAQAVVGLPENQARLSQEDLLDPSAFLKAYLTPGRPAFVPRQAPSVEQAIALIHGAGGLAVWAHPFWNLSSEDEVVRAIDRFRDMGLDGVEAFYTTHTEHQTRLLARRCDELGLLTTGSADFHGPQHAMFSAFRAFRTYGLTPALGPIGS